MPYVVQILRLGKSVFCWLKLSGMKIYGNYWDLIYTKANNYKIS